MASPPGGFSAECWLVQDSYGIDGSAEYTLDVALIWDSRAAGLAEVDELAETLKGILRGR